MFAAVALVLAVAWSRIPRSAPVAAEGRPSPVAGAPSSVGGSLIYAIDVGSGVEVLWTLDLRHREAMPGPPIPPAEQLVDASGLHPGWVGITSVDPNGIERAFLLRGTSPMVRASPVVSGTAVSWSPSGREVAWAIPDRSGPCGGEVIRVTEVRTGASLSSSGVCGRVSSLGRGTDVTYATVTERDRTRILSIGRGRPDTVARGCAALSVSPAADLLAVASGHGAHTPTAALILPRRGSSLQLGAAGEPLLVGRVLAWSADGRSVAVTGREGATAGVYVVDAGSGSARRAPRLVIPPASAIGAAFAADGSLYVVGGGQLFRWFDGVTTQLVLPHGAPAPAGPVLWTR